jgi:hypothetical protein
MDVNLWGRGKCYGLKSGCPQITQINQINTKNKICYDIFSIRATSGNEKPSVMRDYSKAF